MSSSTVSFPRVGTPESTERQHSPPLHLQPGSGGSTSFGKSQLTPTARWPAPGDLHGSCPPRAAGDRLSTLVCSFHFALLCPRRGSHTWSERHGAPATPPPPFGSWRFLSPLGFPKPLGIRPKLEAESPIATSICSRLVIMGPRDLQVLVGDTLVF